LSECDSSECDAEPMRLCVETAGLAQTERTVTHLAECVNDTVALQRVEGVAPAPQRTRCARPATTTFVGARSNPIFQCFPEWATEEMPGASVPEPTPDGLVERELVADACAEGSTPPAPEVAVADAHPTSRPATTPIVAPSPTRRTTRESRVGAGRDAVEPDDRAGAVTR
jgi:hypothetical protein